MHAVSMPVMFHYFHGRGGDIPHRPSPGSVDGGALADFLRAGLASGHLLSADLWLKRWRSGVLHPDDYCLSFDDGLACQRDIALPALDALGIKAMIFPYSCVLKGEMYWAEVFRYFIHDAYPDIDAFYRDFDTAIGNSAHAGHVADALKDFDRRIYLASSPFYSDADRRYRFIRDVALSPDAFFEIARHMMAAWRAALDFSLSRLFMTPDDLLAMSDNGHLIGLHSHRHRAELAAAPYPEIHADFVENLATLDGIGLPRPTVAAHPFGRSSPTSRQCLADLGIALAFTAFADVFEGPMAWPRRDHTAAFGQMNLPLAHDADRP